MITEKIRPKIVLSRCNSMELIFPFRILIGKSPPMMEAAGRHDMYMYLVTLGPEQATVESHCPWGKNREKRGML